MIRLLFLGSGDFPVPIFQKLTKSSRIKITGLITAPSERKHNNLLKDLAEKLKVSTFQPPNLSEEEEKILVKTQPEIILVCNFGQILDETILKYPKLGSLNIHASLLPIIRGACPIEMAIMQGLKKTGITIQLMEKKLDTGDILFQEGIKIERNETGGSLRKKLQTIAMQNIEKVIMDWCNGKIKPRKQNHKKATYCYRRDISREAARINWQDSANLIERKIRAFNPKPIAWTLIKNRREPKRLKIYRGKVSGTKLNLISGHTKIKDGKLLVQTGKGVLSLETVQLEGKNKMPIKEFLLGFKDKINFI